MTAVDCLAQVQAHGEHYQLAINAFIDAFRRAPHDAKPALVADPIAEHPIASPGPMPALVAAVVSSLCQEASVPMPSWIHAVTSPTPFFVLPARSFSMRVRLMLESPPPFRNRGVYVPENYMFRA